MKALLFNHHPDYLWYLQSLLNNIGISCDVASEALTLNLGADYSSTSADNKFRSGQNWYEPKHLFPDMNFTFSNSLEGYDYYFTMNRDIVEKLPYDNKKIIYSTVVLWDIMNCNNYSKYKKISSVDYITKFGGSRITYFVPQRGKLKEKKYISQLIEGYKTKYYDELMSLKDKISIIIAGSHSAPDGIVNDWDILSQTTLLVHHKEYGSCCNAVMKALDCGIPIYMSRENRYRLGFEDVPEFCFIFSDDHKILDAYNISKTIDNNKIQNKFRKIKNIENATKDIKLLLNI